MIYEYLVQAQNWSRYVYVLNNPLRHTDPTGMRSPGKFERAALKKLEGLAKNAEAEGNDDLAKGLLAAKAAIENIISSLDNGKEDVGVNVAVNAILYTNGNSFADSQSVKVTKDGTSFTIGAGQNKCNIFVANAYGVGAGLGFIKNGATGRGYPLIGGKPPAANFLGDAKDRQHLTNLGIVTDGLKVGDIVAWRTEGGEGSGHSTIHIGGNVLVYSGGPAHHGLPSGTPQAKTFSEVDRSMNRTNHESFVVRRYNGKP